MNVTSEDVKGRRHRKWTWSQLALLVALAVGATWWTVDRALAWSPRAKFKGGVATAGIPNLSFYPDLAFSPDGKTLAVASEDAVGLWDVATGQIRAVLRESKCSYRSPLFFSPEGKTLAVCGDQAVAVWDVATGRLRSTVASRSEYGSDAVAFSPDGRTVIIGWKLARGGKLTYFDLPTGREWDGIELAEIDARSYNSSGLALSPDGATCAVSHLRTPPEGFVIKLLDVSTEREKAVLPCTGFLGMRFLPVGRTLVVHTNRSGFEGDQIDLWDIDAGRVQSRLNLPRSILVVQWVISPDGTTLATISWTAEHLAMMLGNQWGVESLSWKVRHMRRNSIHEVKLWDIATGRLLATTGNTDTQGFSSVAFSPDGKTLATVGHYGMVELWDVPAKK